MDRTTATFVDGMGAAAATSGVLTQLQGRIFALLYLQPKPLSLDEIAAGLGLSKSNVSVSIRGLVDWHLVRRTSVVGSRRDHYEAATDFWRVMMEIMERRFRWNLRQVLAAVAETERAAREGGGRGGAKAREEEAFVSTRLQTLGMFFSAVDAGIGAFLQGKPFSPDSVQGALLPVASRGGQRRNT